MHFDRDVLERSHVIPVVVDFWAAWCASCRMLGPVLDALAGEAEGRWELVKLDIEEHPELATAWGVMSIPAVKMFRAGEVTAEFVGALPQEQVRAWLQANLPDPREDELVAILARAQTPFDAALVAPLAAQLERDPVFERARLALARALVADEPERARELARALDDPEETQDIASLGELAEVSAAGDTPLARHVLAARDAFRRRDLDAALESLVDAAMLDRRFAQDLPRRAAVALFHALGQDHPLTRTHQRRLAMALHV